MISTSPTMRILVATDPVDFRKPNHAGRQADQMQAKPGNSSA